MIAAGGDGGEDGDSSTKRTIAATKPEVKKSHNLNHLNYQNLVTLISTITSTAYSFLSENDLFLLPSQTLTLETFLSSTSISLSTLMSLIPSPAEPLSLAPNPPVLPQPQCWFHRFLSTSSVSDSNYDTQWFHVFRMSKPSFNLLLNLLSPSLESALPTIPPNYSLAAALFRLAHGASYKAVARRFRIDSAEACRAFYLVCKEVNDKLGHLFEFSSDLETIVMGFGWNSLPNCFGVLGLAKFGIDGELLGKDGSLMVQALVGSEGRFLDVSAGWPSTMKPQTILLQSKLYLEVEKSKELLNGPSIENDGHLIPRYILGDSYFPLLTWLLTPYNRLNEEDSFSSLERAFNSVHDNAIGIVRIAFQRLRARWQLLAKQWKEECVEFLPFVIVTGCLLHNFLIKCGEPMPDKNTGHVKEVDLPVFDGDVDENAQRIRDILAMHLSQWRSRKIALPS